MKKILDMIINKLKLKIKHYLQSGWLFRPLLRCFWKSKRLVLGDTNKRFACWGWETVDIVDADNNVNFRNDALPFPDESVSLVFSSHVIEHISDESAFHLFSEVHRILKKGGAFRVVCPDLDKVIRAYKENNLYFFLQAEGARSCLIRGIEAGELTKDSLLLHNNLIRTLASYADTGGGPIVKKEVVDQKLKDYNKYEFAKWCVSLLDQDCLEAKHAWGHINAYDFPKLKTMLEEAGFSNNVVRSSLGQSGIKKLRKLHFDQKRHEWISLYVEAIKEVENEED